MKFFAQSMVIISMYAALVFFSIDSMASTVISGTRVIYLSDSKEVSVKITNKGAAPVLIQSWIDNGDQKSRPSSIKVPFVITPPINRIDAGKGQTLRIRYTGENLPPNKESVYWLNVLEVPAKNKTVDNSLQMAFRSRIKLFYRPANLKGNANEAPKLVTWHALSNSVRATNPTPYYVNFVNISVNDKKVESTMIPPLSSLIIQLPSKSGDNISGAFINDYGALNDFVAEIK